MKSLLKKLLAKTPYEISRRAPPNRFQALDATMAGLKLRGYTPSDIIDGGANTGDFARAARRYFPHSVIHLVEPQPGCAPYLQKLVQTNPEKYVLHRVALGAPCEDGKHLVMRTDAAATSTGAHISPEASADSEGQFRVPCKTLDAILAPSLSYMESVFLKLDLQGYELHALKGAIATLKKTDVLLSEISFFAQAYEPPILELMAYLDAAGFDLHDIASVSARTRDNRAKQGDFVFVKRGSALAQDTAWA